MPIIDQRKTVGKVLLSYTTPAEEELFLRRLRAARILAGLEQRDVAAEAGTSQAMISKMELGVLRVHDRWLRFFSKLYQKPVGWFFGEGD